MKNRQKSKFLDDDARQQMEAVGDAEIVVGIPSYNNETTIGHVVRAAEYGLAKYFPKMKAVILNADGGSKDRTQQVVRETSVYHAYDTLLIKQPVHPSVHISGKYEGIPGKGSAFRAFFEATELLGAKCLVVLDSDLRSITPEWIELLAGPVLLKGYDLVTPHYARHKYDGTITNNVVYPLVRSLYGKRIRQPIGGDFGLSRELVTNLLTKNVWETDVARFGIDIFTTVSAVNDGFEVCESFLGAKVHDPKDPATGLSDMFQQVVGTLFMLAGQTAGTWQEVSGSRPLPCFGFKSEIAPVAVEVSVQRMVERFQEGVVRFEDKWASMLRPEEMDGIRHAGEMAADAFRFPMDLWSRTLYTYLATAPGADDPGPYQEHVESLVPLYMARTASFVLETQDMRTAEAEKVVEEQGNRFEELKPFLMEMWAEHFDAAVEDGDGVAAKAPEPARKA